MIDWTVTPHKTYWYLFDAHQSVIGIADDSGQIVVRYYLTVYYPILLHSLGIMRSSK